MLLRKTTLAVYNWASSWDYGTYHIGDQGRLRQACTYVQSRQSLVVRARPKIRHLDPLDGCACASEECVYGGRKVPQSHEMALLENLEISMLSHSIEPHLLTAKIVEIYTFEKNGLNLSTFQWCFFSYMYISIRKLEASNILSSILRYIDVL